MKMVLYQSKAFSAIRLLAILLCSGQPSAEYLSSAKSNVFTDASFKKHIGTHTLYAEADEPELTTCAFKNISHSNSWLKVIQTDAAIRENIYQEGDKSFIKKCTFCYSLWTQSGKTRSLIGQGCWSSGDHCDSNCSARPLGNFQNEKEEARFCCCRGNKCNTNTVNTINNINNYNNNIFNNNNSNKQKMEMKTATGVEVSSFDDNYNKIYVISILIVLLVSVAVVILLHSLLKKSEKKAWTHSHEDGLVLLEPAPDTPPLSLNSLKLAHRVRRGHFGAVYKASLAETNVAVKVFRSKNRDYFLNEKDIYTLPHMKHPAIVEYFGAKEQKDIAGEGKDLMLVFSWACNGSLQQYLTKNTVSWDTFCHMAKSLLEGLVHLHSTIIKNGKFKPGISHRDLNSGNILVKSDLSLCICDMGFAMKLQESVTDNVRSSVSGTLFGVGSVRYMAPEELDGTLNMKSREQTLMQVDVYALGLVLWELAKRCHDLYQGSEVPAYEQAYEREIGLRPNCDEMQNLVSRKNVRPLFPHVWKVSNPAVQLLQDTLEECWDSEPGARLSSQCVLKRICQLPATWERDKGAAVINTDQKKFYLEEGFNSLSSTFSNKSLAGIMTFYNNPKTDYKTLNTAICHNGYRRLESPSGSREDLGAETKVKMDNVASTQWAREQIQPYQGNLVVNTEKNTEFVAKSTKEELNSDLNKLLDCLAVNGRVRLSKVRRQYPVPNNSSSNIRYAQNSIKSVKNTNHISDHGNQTLILESSQRPEELRLLNLLDHPQDSVSHVVRTRQNGSHMTKTQPNMAISRPNRTIPNTQSNLTETCAKSKSNLIRAIKLTENLRRNEENLPQNENIFSHNLSESASLLMDVA